MSEHAVRATPPDVAAEVFGARLDLAEAFAALLVEEGVLRGVIGPREVERLWERHLLNSAVVAELIPERATVIDVGSGGGFPGIPLAIVRPDLAITLLEPMLRRTSWLDHVVAELGLTVSVVRGRAEERALVSPTEIVLSRAVAPLDRLAGWCLPLTADGGAMLAMKGSTAEDEIAEHQAAIRAAGGDSPEVMECGRGTLDPPSRVVRIQRLARRQGDVRRSGAKQRGTRSSGSAHQSGARSGADRGSRNRRDR